MSRLGDRLRQSCAREREQAAFYRTLAAEAETVGDEAAGERLNGLLADEQHHLARLTARLLELGETAAGASGSTPAARLATWLSDAAAREAAEVRWYESFIPEVRDAATAGILREILESERHHLKALGGKWMSAEAPRSEGAES